MYTIKNTTSGCGAKNPIPPGNPGDILYLVSSGVAGAANDVLYTGSGNLYAANSVTTTNVFATRYYGDGGLLSNISSNAITQPFANLVVSNSVTTTNVFAETYYGDGGFLSNISSSAITQPFANLVVSNSVTTTNVFTTNVTATTVSATNVIGTHYGVLAGSNTISGSTQTLVGTAGGTTLNATGNIYVSNSVTTTNVFTTNVSATTVSATNVIGTHYGVLAGSNTASVSTLTATNVIGTHYGVLAGSNTASVSTLTATNVIGTHYGVLAGSNTISGSTQTLGGTAGGTTLNATGNIYVSNSVTTTNVFARTAYIQGYNAQWTWSGGGNISLSSNATSGFNLLWSARFIGIPLSRQSGYNASGFVDINCPTTGTIVYYAATVTTVTCSPLGINIPVEWVGLYYRVTPGQASTSDPTKFALVTYTSSLWTPTSDWILVGTLNNDTVSYFKCIPAQVNIPNGFSYNVVNDTKSRVTASTDFLRSTPSTGAAFIAQGTGLSAASFNYILSGGNDTGNKLVVFVNGSTRTLDGGASNVTIRNDGGRLILGNASFPTILYGKVGIETASPSSLLDFNTSSSINKVISFWQQSAADPATATDFTGFGVATNVLRYQSSSAFGGGHQWYMGATEAMRLGVNSGNICLGIGKIPGNFQLDLSTDSARKLTTTTWATGSDERIKTDIQSANLQTCYDTIKSIDLKYFKWNFPAESNVTVDDNHSLGFIAQDVKKVFPNAVFESNSYGFTDFLSLNTDQILKAMYGALRQTMADKESLEQRLAALEAKLAA